MTWMAWTPQTALFFGSIGIALAVMTIWELVRPTKLARGFLPMATTRGDRFFISLLSAAFIHMLWIATLGEHLWAASALSLIWAFMLMRRG